MRHRMLLLGVLALVAGGVGAGALRDVRDQMAVLEACEAAADGRWEVALAGTADRVGNGETGRAAAECRCRALLATGDGETCSRLITSLLADAELTDWSPGPEIAVHLIQTWRDAGRAQDAAELARRAARAYPDDPDLFYLELVTASAVGDESRALEELSARVVAAGPAAVRMRVSLANRHLLRGDPAGALVALGNAPPPEAGDATGLWFETRGAARAQAGDLDGLDRTYAAWRAAGGDSTELEARYALTLSLANLKGAEPTLALLERAVARGPFEPKLDEALRIRLVLALAANGRSEEAVAAYDAGREHFALEGLTREELLRSAAHRSLADSGPLPPARVTFETATKLPGAQLWVSPRPGTPLDAPYELLAPGNEGWKVERRPDEAPLRWVLRDADGATRGSGTLSPRPEAAHHVEMLPRTAAPPAAPPARERAAADGRRRLAVVLLDCGDWRIVQYLRARGELPLLDALLARGHRAVLDSDPPLTAAALEALVWPERSRAPGFVALVHRFGLELAGLSSIGDNPFAALEWVLPESPSFFDVVGGGQHVAANLLFSHGGIDAGRHGEITGPQGRRRRLEVGSAARDLDADERARFPTLAAVHRERDAIHLRTIAAEFDAAEQIAAEGEIDVLALRIEALDILTHGHFAATTRDGQDDGAGLLYAVYRYIDSRLAALYAELDADDVLVVMSDHGIRTAMEHGREALFVAAGAGIPAGRSPGTPSLAGVPHRLASLLGIETRWRDTGIGHATRVARHVGH